MLRDKFKRGGGFLNNVAGLITKLRFTTEPDFGKGATTPKVEAGKETPLWAEISARVDGSDKIESTHLFAGGADKFVIGEDETSLTPTEDGVALWGNTAFDNFYASYVDNKGSDVDAGDDGTLNFGHIVGARVQFVQVKDETATKRAAENWKKNKGNAKKNFNELGQKKGSDGKYYDIRTLQVSEVFSEGNDIDATPAKGTPAKKAGPATKAAPAKAGKPAAKQTPASDYDVDADAFEVLVTLIGKAKDQKLKKNDLNAAVTRELVNEPVRREAVRKHLADEATIQAYVDNGSITFTKAGKDQIIALA